MPFVHLEVKNLIEKKKEKERKERKEKVKEKERKKGEKETVSQEREKEELQLRKKRKEANHLLSSTAVSRQSRRHRRRHRFCNGKSLDSIFRLDFNFDLKNSF